MASALCEALYMQPICCGCDWFYYAINKTILDSERHYQVVMFVAIFSDQQLPQTLLPGSDVHHLIFTV